MVATLGLAGLRISEMMDLRVAQVDLPRSRFKLVDAKTEAGVREVEITLYLRDELLALRDGPPGARAAVRAVRSLLRHRDRQPPRPGPVPRPDPRPRGRARNSNRAQSGLAPLPEITPHSLRRTWATFAAMIGRDPKWIAAQIGHVSPSFTFSVYQQVATRRYIDEQAVWTLMRFADEPAERAPAGRSRASSGTRAARSDREGRVRPELDRLTDDDDDLSRSTDPRV